MLFPIEFIIQKNTQKLGAALLINWDTINVKGNITVSSFPSLEYKKMGLFDVSRQFVHL